MARTAIVICTESEPGGGPERPLLGLSVGERLLRTLAKGGVTQVVYAGAGPRPEAPPGMLQEIDANRIDGPPVVVPSDVVLDPALVTTGAPIPEDLPIRHVPIGELAALLADPASFVAALPAGKGGRGKGFALRVTDDEAATKATRALMLSLHKDADGIISRHLNRRISTFLSRRLAPLPIRPNHITAVVFLIGILSGPFAFLGTHLGFAIGGLCYWLSAVLDGCDGEISRLKFQGSPLGAWLDTVVDDVVCLSYISGMYYGLNRNSAHPYWGHLGLLAVVFFILTVLPRYYIMAKTGSGDYQKLAKVIRPTERGGVQRALLMARDIVFRTDFLPFAGMVTAVIGYPQVFAAPFAVGAVASAIDTLHTVFSRKKAATG